jgi:glycosyltransferase involved in cell wall biosynthesis
VKQIYLEPGWQLPASYDELMADPPDGYRFLLSDGPLGPAIRGVGNLRFVRYVLVPRIQELGVPINLLKSLADWFRPPVRGSHLTYAVNHLVLRPERWVLDLNCELPAILVGPERRFDWYRGLVQRALESEYCRKIFARVEAGRKSLLAAFGQKVAKKADVVYWSVPRKRFTKSPANEKVKLLFVGSVNFPGQFEPKGGKEAIEAYLLSRKKHDNLEMVVRSDMPTSFKRRYRGVPGLKIIDEVTPWEELEREYQTADIFIQPGHITPGMVFLEAMSYELPVITTDVWGNGEMVKDGKTGFLVPKSSLAPDFEGDRLYARSRRFERVIRNVDGRMVGALAEKLSILIENPQLRRRMGRAGRAEIEGGMFSTARRNQKLRQVLDEATAR